MAADPAGFAKLKLLLTDSVGTVTPGIQLLIASDTYNQALVDYVAAHLDDSTLGTWMGGVDSRWTLTGLKLIMSTGTIDIESTASVSHVGGQTSHQGDRGSAVVHGWEIGSFYRGGKPRMYCPGPGEFATGSITHWDATFAAAQGTRFDAWLTHIGSITHGGTPPTLTSVIPGCIRRRGPGISGPTFFPYAVGTRVEGRICSQRKRLGRL